MFWQFQATFEPLLIKDEPIEQNSTKHLRLEFFDWHFILFQVEEKSVLSYVNSPLQRMFLLWFRKEQQRKEMWMLIGKTYYRTTRCRQLDWNTRKSKKKKRKRKRTEIYILLSGHICILLMIKYNKCYVYVTFALKNNIMD